MVELLLHRLALQRLLLIAMLPGGRFEGASLGVLVRVLDGIGSFALYFSAVLAWLMCSVFFVRVLRGGSPGLPAKRVVFGVLGLMVCLVGAVQMVGGGGWLTAAPLYGSAALMALALPLRLWSVAGSYRERVGVTLVAWLVAAQLIVVLAQQPILAAMVGPAASRILMAMLNRADAVAVGAAILTFALLAQPRRARGVLGFGPVLSILAFGVSAGLAFAMMRDYAVFTRLVYQAFNIPLAVPPSYGALPPSMTLLAVALFVLCVSSLVAVGGRSRTSAMGLLLVAFSGFHLRVPALMFPALAGLLALVYAAEGASPVAAAGPYGVAPAPAGGSSLGDGSSSGVEG